MNSFWKSIFLIFPLSFITQFHVMSNYWIRFSHDSENYQGRGLCYLPKPKAEADNTNRGLDNFAIMRKPNPIIVLLYNYKCRSVETFHRTTTK